LLTAGPSFLRRALGLWSVGRRWSGDGWGSGKLSLRPRHATSHLARLATLAPSHRRSSLASFSHGTSPGRHRGLLGWPAWFRHRRGNGPAVVTDLPATSVNVRRRGQRSSAVGRTTSSFRRLTLHGPGAKRTGRDPPAARPADRPRRAVRWARCAGCAYSCSGSLAGRISSETREVLAVAVVAGSAPLSHSPVIGTTNLLHLARRLGGGGLVRRFLRWLWLTLRFPEDLPATHPRRPSPFRTSGLAVTGSRLRLGCGNPDVSFTRVNDHQPQPTTSPLQSLAPCSAASR